jgi:Bifunctional DNA primase/polymerase, N-terminal/Family of unknown function (DUF5906)
MTVPHNYDALTVAKALRDRGYFVFPVAAGDKKAAITGWPDLATRDEATIRGWFANGRRNVAICTNRFQPDGEPMRQLLVVDIDMKGGKDGLASLATLEAEHGPLPATRTHSTPSGGEHRLFVVDEAYACSVDMLGAGLDVRAGNGYILGPGSRVGDSSYAVTNEAPIAEAPEWLRDLCGRKREKSVNREPVAGIDPERAEKRVIDYLQTAERSVKGAGGDQCAYRVAAKCLALGATEAQTLDLMLSEHWDDGCGWSADRLGAKVRHAKRYMLDQPGAEAPEAQFEPVPEPASGSHPFDTLNREWCVVAEPPRTVLYRERIDAGTGQRVHERFLKQSFLDLLADQTMDGSELAMKWWRSPRRRKYQGGVEFAPGGTLPANVLNLWGGFAVKPAAGNWSALRQHIRDVICGGSETVDTYVMNWLARMVQRPGEPGQVALVLRGGRGTGKGTFGEMIGRLFGRHAIHLSDPGQLAGRFSGHLACKIFVFADEAFFVGDRASEPRLKAMITERKLTIEAKGADIVSVRNCAHILMASNDDHVILAGADERRYCVVDVADSKRQDIGYFQTIREQMEAGGLAAMLHELLERDISAFEVWKYPKTRASAEQQTHSLRGTERWLFDALYSARIGHHDWADKETVVPRDEAHQSYKQTRPNHEREEANNAFGRKLKRILECAGQSFGKQQINRKWHAVFPPLYAAREAFEKYIGQSLEWMEPDTPGGSIFD